MRQGGGSIINPMFMLSTSVGINGEVLAGVLPEKQYRLVSAWLALHKDELYEAWNNAVQMKQISKIKPLS